MALFKDSAMNLNSNAKVQKSKPNHVLRAERLKHEQNKRASEKRGLPKFNMLAAKQLLDGKFHEEDEDEEDEVAKPCEAVNLFAQSYADV